MDFVIYNKKLNIEDTYTKPNITLAPFYNLEKQIKFINEEINNNLNATHPLNAGLYFFFKFIKGII